MAKQKVTITLDRAKADRARWSERPRLLEVIDVALEGLIHAERLRRDVEADRRLPPSPEERALADLADSTGLADDVDWAALYADAE